MLKSIVGLGTGVLLLALVGVANATLLNVCTGTVCDGSYNLVISDNDSDPDAMFTIEDSSITSWMWIDSLAGQSFGFNALPNVRGLDESILLGRGLGIDFTNSDEDQGELAELILYVDAVAGDNTKGTFAQRRVGQTSFDACPIAGQFACTYQVTAKVPEPTTLALMGLGIAGLGFRRKTKISCKIN